MRALLFAVFLLAGCDDGPTESGGHWAQPEKICEAKPDGYTHYKETGFEARYTSATFDHSAPPAKVLPPYYVIPRGRCYEIERKDGGREDWCRAPLEECHYIN